MKENHKARRIIGRTLGSLAYSILVLLTLSLSWGIKNFGSVGMDEILFTLNMPLEGSGSGFIENYIATALVPSLIFLVIVLIVMLPNWHARRVRKAEAAGEPLPREHKRMSKRLTWGIGLAWLAILILLADKQFGFFHFVEMQMHQSHLIEEEYVDPNDVELTFPEEKRNLIYILMESGESSLQDKEHGGLFDVNYIPEMTRIAEENVSFSQSQTIEGAAVAPACGWTMAGMVAESAGLPLKLYSYDDVNVDNSMGQYASFLPGVTSLGDILLEQGYNNYFMIGSEAPFGGRDKYMKQHGNYEIWDYFTPGQKGLLDPSYHVWWGYEDQKLYEYAKSEITRLAQEDKPFNFAMLTVDTHHTGGYKCPLCRDDYPEQYGNVWACASRQVDEFVKWIQEQPFYENTTIVICGDHCSMDTEFYKDFYYDKHHGETLRKVYNAVINPAVEPVREKDRRFTTMDMFPTTLAAMGVQIEGERLGLGTNLFSGEETLSEKYGYQTLFDELNRKSVFYNEHLLYAAPEEAESAS